MKKVNAKINNIIEAIENGMFNISMKEKMGSLEKQKSELIIKITEEKLKQKDDYTISDIRKFLEQGRGISDKKFKEKKFS